MGGIKTGHGFGRQERGRNGIPYGIHIGNHTCYTVQFFQFLIHGDFFLHISLGHHKHYRVGRTKHFIDSFHITAHLCGLRAVYLASSIKEVVFHLPQEGNRQYQNDKHKRRDPKLHDQSREFIKFGNKSAMLCFIYQTVCGNSQRRKET